MKTDGLKILLKRFSGRLTNVKLIGSGSLASVFRAEDSRRAKTCSLKVFDKGPPDFLAEYKKHLLNIRESLTGESPIGLLLPYEVGEVDGVYYELFDYLPEVRDLESVIESGGLPLLQALEVLSQVAGALNYLHSRNLIHADVKPSNILITSEEDTGAYLIDFGMAHILESGTTTLFAATYKYIHPSLKSVVGPFGKESSDPVILGPYIDIYALGVVAFRMFAGNEAVPHPLSEDALTMVFQNRNKELREVPVSFVRRLSTLVLQMLKVQADTGGTEGQTLSKKLRDLKGEALKALPRIVDHSRVITPLSHARGVSPHMPVVSETIERLQSIADSLESATSAMFRTSKTIEVLVDKNADSEVLSEMDSAFMTAKKRVGTSWSIAVVMTSITFLLITTMIVCAVVLAFVGGSGSWGLVFGGASVPLIIGVLVWRPFDRVFRATILAQQIEMIHVRASSSYRMTADLQNRLEICRDATEGLRTLFQEHEITSKQKNKKRVNKRARRVR